MNAPAAAVALLFAAASLGQFQHWADSPQGYFMTKGERAEWARVTAEDEAARFVDKFLAARGARFAEEVAARAREADENLTVAGKRGSQTLRGKIAIVLGRPSSVTIKQWSGDKSATMAEHIFSPGHPHAVANIPPAPPPASDLRKRYSVDYKLAYPQRTIVVAVDPTTGEDRILDARAAREAGELLEAAAEASQKPSR
jgi:GWxTD domain-containing protein